MSQLLTPQPGKQTDFLSSTADIVIYGGGAGAGKTRGLLMEPLRHLNNKKFRALIFRRSLPQIKKPGALWDEALAMYGEIGDVRIGALKIVFKSGMEISFSHMNYEKDKKIYDGSQIPLICFDELQTFEESQFRYMFARNRSDCGVNAYMRCTCNPEPNSWILKYIDWFVGSDGFPIQERSGKVRWFVAIDDHLSWADSKADLKERFGKQCEPKSLTFIPATVYDNPELLRANPGYLANLQSLTKMERQRLLEGNWNISIKKGDWFDRKWVKIVDDIPEYTNSARYWDRAATIKDADHRNPDATAGIKMIYVNGIYYVVHLEHFFQSPHGVRNRIIRVAINERETACIVERDPGAAGKVEAQFLVNDILKAAKCEVRMRRVTQDKLTRFKPFSSAAEAGIIYVLKGAWNDIFFQELESFGTDGNHHDDIVDASAGAFNFLHDQESRRPLLIAI